MLKDLLPISICEILNSRFADEYIYELRIRCNKPIYINYKNTYIPLKNDSGNIIFADKKLIDYIIARATDVSLYKFNNQLKNGFLSVNGGVRIGIGGDVVVDDNGEVKTIKNFSSLVIRVPHQIKGCAEEVMPYIADDTGIKNTLIIAPPGAGKTTFLRDIARSASMYLEYQNILIIDERYEIASVENGDTGLDVGKETDVLSGSSKEYGFTCGIRSMRPDVIITDEIASKSDINGIRSVVSSGVKVVASCHGKSHLDLKNKPQFASILNEKIFDRFILLSSREGAGTVEMVLNSVLEPIFIAK